ncbi:rod shape-determining protein RodA [Phragmitibacter flavus]|uniref:Rod shape-determining protein RodA n=1 Tax=Phragmitibacter flavus TaxID=2576071 RepID=A0A5R8KER4_9BACT|nr:FtsW/RodA/SpoVE family cell cycle protein [Phragmitibacter flavus]TLD70475.1 rod shape-determining protein RodA [Phragmitibacter flavus]
MTPLFRKFLGINWLLFANMILLLVWGVWAIYNASSFRDGAALASKWRDQVQWGAVGMVVFFGAALIDYKWIRWGAGLMYIAGIAGLVAVKLFGIDLKGSKSVIDLGPVSIQPSQMAIVATIAVLAVILGDMHRITPWFRYHWLRLGVCGILAAVPMAMVLKEPDLGSAAVYGPVVVAMLLVGSIPFRYLITLFLVVMCVLPLAYFFGLKPYQKKRVEVFTDMLMNKKVDVQGDAWMADKVQIAVGSAGFDGKGPLSVKVLDQRSVHRTFFSETEAINDFIYAVIVEEFGFRGGMFQIAFTAMMLLQCVFVAFYARDQLGRLLAVGVTAMMFAHAMQNMGMNVLMMPITGLPLPFTSYGGTFLVVCLFLMGLTQSVWIHRNVSPVSNKRPGDQDEEVAY